MCQSNRPGINSRSIFLENQDLKEKVCFVAKRLHGARGAKMFWSFESRDLHGITNLSLTDFATFQCRKFPWRLDWKTSGAVLLRIFAVRLHTMTACLNAAGSEVTRPVYHYRRLGCVSNKNTAEPANHRPITHTHNLIISAHLCH